MAKDRPFKVGILPDRWEGGVAGLTWAAEFVYWRLSLRMMATGRAVPEIDGPAVCRFFPRYKKSLEELMRKEKVKLLNGELLIERALAEHRVAVEERERAKRRGQAGAGARWGGQGDAQASAQGHALASRQASPTQHSSSAHGIAPLPPNKIPTLVGSEAASGSEPRTPLARGLRPLAACLPGAETETTDPGSVEDEMPELPEFLRRKAKV